MILSPKQLEIFYDSFSASFSPRFNAKKMPDCNLLNIKEIKLKTKTKVAKCNSAKCDTTVFLWSSSSFRSS